MAMQGEWRFSVKKSDQSLHLSSQINNTSLKVKYVYSSMRLELILCINDPRTSYKLK